MRRIILLTIALAAASITQLAGGIAEAGAATQHAAVFPSVAGAINQVPKLAFPSGAAPGTLEIKVLHKGSGPVAKQGNVLAVNYLGQIWGGKVFDSSFKRRQLFLFGVGLGQVISGWDKGLLGVRAGSRVLLVIPPADGYKKAGQPSAGIKGTSVLAFVVDVVDVYGGSAEASTHATPEAPVKGIKVSGKLGAAPTKITIAKGTAKPKAVSVTVLDRASGGRLAAGPVVVQYEAVNWSGAVQQSTWASGQPYSFTVASGTSFPDILIGIPVGSRVLVELPVTSGSGPFAMVLDIVAQPKYP